MSTSNGSLAVVTGGSFGLGLDIAHHLMVAGFQVMVCGRRSDRLDAAAERLPGLRTVQTDLTKAEDRDRLFEAIAGTPAPCDLLVNNAAVSVVHDYTNAFTLEQDRARREFETNLLAPVELTRRFLLMRRERGWDERPATIANVSTPGALFPLEANPIYSSSKAGFHMFTLSLRRHLARTPVRVVEIFPPALATGLSPDMNVPGLETNGPDVIDEVARRSVEGILAGEPTVLPHPQSVALVGAIGGNAESLADRVNPSLSRKQGWDREALP